MRQTRTGRLRALLERVLVSQSFEPFKEKLNFRSPFQLLLREF